MGRRRQAVGFHVVGGTAQASGAPGRRSADLLRRRHRPLSPAHTFLAGGGLPRRCLHLAPETRDGFQGRLVGCEIKTASQLPGSGLVSPASLCQPWVPGAPSVTDGGPLVLAQQSWWAGSARPVSFPPGSVQDRQQRALGCPGCRAAVVRAWGSTGRSSPFPVAGGPGPRLRCRPGVRSSRRPAGPSPNPAPGACTRNARLSTTPDTRGRRIKNRSPHSPPGPGPG